MRIKSSWWTQRWTLHSNYPINDWHAYYTVAPKSSAYDLLFIEWKRVPTVKQCKLNCWAVIITQRAVDEERHSTKHLPPSRAAPSIASPSSVMSDSPIRLANCVWQSHRINNTSPGVFFITGSITAKPLSVSKLALQLLHRPITGHSPPVLHKTGGSLLYSFY